MKKGYNPPPLSGITSFKTALLAQTGAFPILSQITVVDLQVVLNDSFWLVQGLQDAIRTMWVIHRQRALHLPASPGPTKEKMAAPFALQLLTERFVLFLLRIPNTCVPRSCREKVVQLSSRGCVPFRTTSHRKECICSALSYGGAVIENARNEDNVGPVVKRW